MCLVCKEWQAGKLTSKEALDALGELIDTDINGKEHYFEVADKILDKEIGDSHDQS